MCLVNSKWITFQTHSSVILYSFLPVGCIRLLGDKSFDLCLQITNTFYSVTLYSFLF